MRRCLMPNRVLSRPTTHCALRHTTILSVRKGNKVVIMGDNRVTLGQAIIAKDTAKKLRRAGTDVMVGFAGSTADAIALLEKLEGKLQEYPGQLLRASVELAKDWRGDKMLRKLEASLIVCDENETLEIDGQGNVLTTEADGIAAIGSGGQYARAAARALIDIEGMDAEAICRKSMKIATSIDIFSNGTFDIDIIEKKKERIEGEMVAATTTSSSSSSSSSSSATSAADSLEGDANNSKSTTSSTTTATSTPATTKETPTTSEGGAVPTPSPAVGKSSTKKGSDEGPLAT